LHRSLSNRQKSKQLSAKTTPIEATIRKNNANLSNYPQKQRQPKKLSAKTMPKIS
jgi:hypothetical protein